MTFKTFGALCVATILAVALAVVTVLQQPRLEANDKQGERLFPSLEKDVARLKSVVVSHGGESTHFDWDGKTWHARERDNFPASAEKLNGLVVGLARATKIEGKTRLADRYSRLQLEDPAPKGTMSREVALQDAAGKDIAKLIVGRKQGGLGPGGTYVRLPNDPQTWLVTGDLTAIGTVGDWLQREIVDIKAPNINSVTVTHPNGDKVVVSRPNSMGNLSFQNLPKGASPGQDVSPEEYAGILAGMNMDDVAKADAKPFPKDKTITAVIEGVGGLQVNIDLATLGEETWIKIKASAPAPAPAAPNVTDMRTDWSKTVNDLNAKADGWVFQVPAYQVAALKHHTADILRASPQGRGPMMQDGPL